MKIPDVTKKKPPFCIRSQSQDLATHLNLVTALSTAAEKQSFLDEFRRSTSVHGESYELDENDRTFNLKLKPDAPMNGGFPCVYMDIRDWRTRYKDPPSQASTDQLGVYESRAGDFWIDGSWQKAYGRFQKNDRNARITAAQLAYPTAKIHGSPYHVQGWVLIGWFFLCVIEMNMWLSSVSLLLSGLPWMHRGKNE